MPRPNCRRAASPCSPSRIAAVRKDSGTLAEGIPETVLHQLGLLPGLTVIARGSSFAFRDAGEDLRVIGRKLNVRYLLEGSVQAAGNRLRVTSRLVDAQTGVAVWSEQFDPKLEDLFAVQDEIALAVARAMKLTLDAASDQATGARASATKNYDAYFEFLRGRALLASVRSQRCSRGHRRADGGHPA